MILIYSLRRIVQNLENEEMAKHSMSENAKSPVGEDAGPP